MKYSMQVLLHSDVRSIRFASLFRTVHSLRIAWASTAELQIWDAAKVEHNCSTPPPWPFVSSHYRCPIIGIY